jgi:thiosulfate/3-mercaptopyruvate sulfurtransferase
MRNKFLALFSILLFTVFHSLAQSGTALNIPKTNLIQPADLNKLITNKSATQPLIFQIGSRMMFDQAHIPNAEYIGAGSQGTGIEALKSRVAKLPKSQTIILYCGCCPWIRCPNVGPAFTALQNLGFSNVKVLYLEEDFGTNWVGSGYAVAH